MTSFRSLRFASLWIALAGCYENPPPAVPRPQLPELVPGAALEVESHTNEENRQMTKHDRVCVGSDCSTVSVTSTERVNVHHAAASYGGAPITLGQAQALGDPTYLRDLARMDELRASCRHATVPKYLGEALLTIGGLLIVQGSATSDGSVDKPYVIAGAAGMVGGIVSYALGKYALGGQDCEGAREIYQSRRAEWASQDQRDVENSLADQLETVARDFNRQAKTAQQP
ncbi:hypothetical protein BH11MYX1_BH11MYX1_55440 [soil metagenome]